MQFICNLNKVAVHLIIVAYVKCLWILWEELYNLNIINIHIIHTQYTTWGCDPKAIKGTVPLDVPFQLTPKTMIKNHKQTPHNPVKGLMSSTFRVYIQYVRKSANVGCWRRRQRERSSLMSCHLGVMQIRSSWFTRGSTWQEVSTATANHRRVLAVIAQLEQRHGFKGRQAIICNVRLQSFFVQSTIHIIWRPFGDKI